ncbi:polyprenyl synthetase family protein [bacterium]|nr:polyprenyl synthetase family protein [bacterium]
MEQISNIISDDIKNIESIIFSRIDTDNFVKFKIRDFLKSPSKKIRSILSILYLRSQNADINENLLKIIAAGELIHNASLLHDDVIDSAETRRNLTVFAKDVSPKMSIIAGDLLVSEAIELVLSINSEYISEKFIQCTKQMSEAEIQQFTLRGNLPDIDTYTTICEGKTSALFCTLLKSLSVLSGLDENIADNFGKIFGIVFQIRNDSEPNSAQNDINNKIYTMKDIIGIEKTNSLIDNYKEKMKSIIREFPDNIYSKGLIDLINKL